jgi:eukaryotic-like serine/threonine-protein kinase
LTAAPVREYRPFVEPSAQAVPFGRYLLKERLAQGGMGEVFRAVAIGEAGFEKPVVVKRILPAHAGRSDFLELFIAEAKLMTRLDHPNIVEVLDFGRGEGGEAFLVLEFVKGLDLGQLADAYAARGEPFPLALALFIISQVLRGLHHAHAQPDGRLVHRDISPGNVLLSTEGEVKVADFGVALVQRAGEEKEGPEGIVGKPSYMAPEQFDEADVDPRADLFSVGVVLYELITRELPFAGKTFVAQQAAAHRGDFRSASELRRDLPPEVSALIARALSPKRADRFPDARSMAQAIEAGAGLHAAGLRLATGDDVADAVRAAMSERPAKGRRVIGLSGSLGQAEDVAMDPTLPRELTRTGGVEGVGAFTLRLMAPAEEAAEGPRSRSPAPAKERGAPAAPLERRTVRIEDLVQEPRPAPPSLAGRATDSDPPEIPLQKAVIGRRGVGIAVGGLVLALAVGFALRRPAASGPFNEATAVASADHPVETALPVSSAPRAVEPAQPSAPSAPSSIAPAPPRVGPLRASASPLHSAPPAAAPPSAEPTEECQGAVRIASNGSWTVSGGPQTVQSPGVYTFRCGSFSLVAVSRADPTLIKQARVTVRRGETASVDLR